MQVVPPPHLGAGGTQLIRKAARPFNRLLRYTWSRIFRALCYQHCLQKANNYHQRPITRPNRVPLRLPSKFHSTLPLVRRVGGQHYHSSLQERPPPRPCLSWARQFWPSGYTIINYFSKLFLNSIIYSTNSLIHFPGFNQFFTLMLHYIIISFNFSISPRFFKSNPFIMLKLSVQFLKL